MNYITNIIKPDRLLLLWIPPTGHRMNRIVGELIRNGSNANLKYYHSSDDFKKAITEGFVGYPLLSGNEEFHENVIEYFAKRLPPKSRDDYSYFLESIRLHLDESLDDFTLLGYSRARIPEDDFCLIHPMENAKTPFELLMDVAGTRYNEAPSHYDEIRINNSVEFILEPENEWDTLAIAIYHDSYRIGYVCRGILQEFHKWLNSGFKIQGIIEKKNGTRENPKIDLFVTVK